jgi:hypothetical protein
MANGVYNRGKREVANGGIDLDTSDLRVLLVKDTYTFNADHQTVDDGSANDPQSHEVSVAGYARFALTSKAVTEDDVNDFAYLDADDALFSALAAGQTVGGAVLFKHTGLDTTAVLLAFYDLTDTLTNGGDISVVWNTPALGGVLKLA